MYFSYIYIYIYIYIYRERERERAHFCAISQTVVFTEFCSLLNIYHLSVDFE